MAGNAQSASIPGAARALATRVPATGTCDIELTAAVCYIMRFQERGAHQDHGMDTLAHALYGATLFSRTGLAGGRRGARRGFDWTVWAAAAFGLLPDAASIGVHFTAYFLGSHDIRFMAIPDYVFTLYKATHSVVVAAACVGAIRLVCRPLWVPALAWPLHIAMDIFTHARGRWQTPFLYPVSDVAFDGINWWMVPWLIRAYWALLPALWIGIVLMRRHARRASRA